MAAYTSTPVTLPLSAEATYSKLTNLEGLKEILARIPEDQISAEQKSLLDKITISGDKITIPGGPTGDITLKLGDCTPPTRVNFWGIGTPVPVSIHSDIESTGPESCQVTVIAELAVPAMLKPMINGPMQKMVDQVAQSLTQLTRF